MTHSGLFLACVFLIPLLPESYCVWPWPLLVPVLSYLVFVVAVPYLRRTFQPPPLGGQKLSAWLIALVLSLATSLVLLGHQHSCQPDLQYLLDRLPVNKLGWMMTAILFPPFNAALEEIVFRGFLFDGFRACRGRGFAIVGSSVIFGLAHYGGYPPGSIGCILAMVFGLFMAILRLYSRGLLVPVVVHVFADATILVILYNWTGSKG